MAGFTDFLKQSGLSALIPVGFAALFGGKGSLKSWAKGVTGSGLTDAQKEANAFEAEQAQKQMDFQQQMASTQYQRGVVDMRNAGLNPALMYGSGASGNSAMSGAMAASESPGSPSLDPIGLIGQIANLKLLNAQKRNIDADTASKEASAAESRSRIMLNELTAQYYPKVTQATLDSISASISQAMSNVELNRSRVANTDADTALKDSQRFINEITSEWLPKLNAAKESSDKASAAQAFANAAYQRYFTDFTKRHNGQTPGHNDLLALGAAISEFVQYALGGNPENLGKIIGDALKQAFRDYPSGGR